MKTLTFIFLNLTLLGYSLVGSEPKALDLPPDVVGGAHVELSFFTSNRVEKRFMTSADNALQVLPNNRVKFINPNEILYRGIFIGGIAVGIAFIATFLIHKYFSTHTKTTTKHELSEENLKAIKEHTTTILGPITQKIDELTIENQGLKQHVQHLQSAIQGLSKKDTIVQLHNMGSIIPTTTSSSSLYNSGSSNKQ